MNYFSMCLLKIETKTYQFCFELKHHGILNEKKVNYKLNIDSVKQNRDFPRLISSSYTMTCRT